jgi:excisionase family DNA binding protein
MKRETPPLQYPIEEAAELLRCHRNTVGRLIAAGKLKSHLIGRRRYIRHAEIERLITEAEAQQAA